MTMEHTRDELIKILERIKQKRNTLNKNENQIQRLKKRTSTKNNLVIGLIVTFVLLVPILLMSYIDGQTSSSGVTLIFHSVLPAIIPGYYYIFGFFYFTFIILFVYSIISISRKNSYLYKLNVIQRINNRIESKHRSKIAKLQQENENILSSNDFSVIPYEYSHPRAIDDLQRYLINKRANNLSEAIEVYELEEYRDRQISIQSARLSSAIRAESNTQEVVDHLRRRK